MGGKHQGENREGKRRRTTEGEGTTWLGTGREGYQKFINTNPLAGNERYFIPRAAFIKKSHQLSWEFLCVKCHWITCTSETHDGITGGRSSTSVNGDIAIQWEWSNFDHSYNPNPLTDYDKTAQLITSTRRTRNPKFVPIGRKGAPGEIREI